MSKTEWAWRKPNAEHAYGPFTSRGAALVDAAETAGWEDGVEICVGRVEWPDPVTYMPSDLGLFIDHLDDQAYDDFSFWDDAIFEVKTTEKEAQAELIEFMSNWAKKHLKSCCWRIIDEERVTLLVTEGSKEVSVK